MIFKNYVPQANNSGKLFIFICVLMLIFHIYDLNQATANILYYVSIILLIISTFNYIKEHLKRLKI